MSTIKEGDDAHIRGFLMNKLYTLQAWVKPHGQPKRHHSLINLQKGYDRSYWGKFKSVFKVLNKEGIIYIFKHKGDKIHACAILDQECIERGIAYANIFRQVEGYPEWDLQFNEKS